MKFNDQKKLYRQNALIQSDIRCLPDSRCLEVIQVPGECAEIICNIHKTMGRLAPIGDDERRSLWFEVKGKMSGDDIEIFQHSSKGHEARE